MVRHLKTVRDELRKHIEYSQRQILVEVLRLHRAITNDINYEETTVRNTADNDPYRFLFFG